jgi:hypothetical protein
MSWKVTVRVGPKVGRERFDSLDDALGFARESADRVRREGRLGSVSAFREYTPGERVQARIELTGPGFMNRASGGLDVMGDGTLLAYDGAVRKRPLDADSLDEAVEGLRAALTS